MRTRTSAALVLASFAAAAALVVTAEPPATAGDPAAGQPVTVMIEDAQVPAWDCPDDDESL